MFTQPRPNLRTPPALMAMEFVPKITAHVSVPLRSNPLMKATCPV